MKKILGGVTKLGQSFFWEKYKIFVSENEKNAVFTKKKLKNKMDTFFLYNLHRRTRANSDTQQHLSGMHLFP